MLDLKRRQGILILPANRATDIAREHLFESLQLRGKDSKKLSVPNDEDSEKLDESDEEQVKLSVPDDESTEEQDESVEEQVRYSDD